MRDKKITILEIGLLRADTDHRRQSNAAEGVTTAAAGRAPSLEMWRAYFPIADIFGFDIDDFTNVKIEGCRIVRGDMSSREDLVGLARMIGRPIDIVVEDGSHVSHHQQLALGCLFPFVRSGGIYAIEDMNWQDERIERIDVLKTRDVLRRFQIDSTFDSPFCLAEERKYLEESVSKLYLFDSLAMDVPDVSDALAVLVKK
jgi:hypothetical protein